MILQHMRGTVKESVKGNWILFKFLFLMQKSILYAKIAISQQKKNFPIQF